MRVPCRKDSARGAKIREVTCEESSIFAHAADETGTPICNADSRHSADAQARVKSAALASEQRLEVKTLDTGSPAGLIVQKRTQRLFHGNGSAQSRMARYVAKQWMEARFEPPARARWRPRGRAGSQAGTRQISMLVSKVCHTGAVASQV
eukprot:1075061-Pleurochrysis_carterae.AAC.5